MDDQNTPADRFCASLGFERRLRVRIERATDTHERSKLEKELARFLKLGATHKAADRVK